MKEYYLKCIYCNRETDERYSIFTPDKKVAHFVCDGKSNSYGVLRG